MVYQYPSGKVHWWPKILPQERVGLAHQELIERVRGSSQKLVSKVCQLLVCVSADLADQPACRRSVMVLVVRTVLAVAMTRRFQNIIITSTILLNMYGEMLAMCY